MSFISVRDQFGHPPPAPCERINVRLAIGRKSSDEAYDDRFTDNGGNMSFVNPLPSIDGYTLYANYRDVIANYGNASVYVADLEAAPITITLQKTIEPPAPSGGCPVNWNKAEFSAWFNINKVGNVVTQANMVAMQPALVKCGFEWQNMCRPPDQWRPRIHQPPFLSGPCSGSTHDVDCGDFGGPWILTFRY